jgi:CheY-like chemotaxis protein
MPNDRDVILLAEDDPDDVRVIRRAFKSAGINKSISVVGDGAELLDYRHHDDDYKEEGSAPKPSMIFLDINMPGMNGLTALQEVKLNPLAASIPVIVLTTSNADLDIKAAYAPSAASYVTKP